MSLLLFHLLIIDVMRNIFNKIRLTRMRVVPENLDKFWFAMLPMFYPAETLTTMNIFILSRNFIVGKGLFH